MMDIKIEERAIGAVTVLDIVGKLTMDQGPEHLKDKINSLISQGRNPDHLESRTSAVH